ncbi:MAG: aldo/keto reductase [Ruminococcus sp.]|nr:aldo/keto reductase [Ruminococcus sp.]
MDFCKNEQIQVEVYFPIAHGEALKNPIITELAAKYGVSAAQLCIWYVLQLGTIALPKTANPEHMKNNADIDFVITDGDFQTLLQMEELQDYVAYNIFPVFSGKPLV